MRATRVTLGATSLSASTTLATGDPSKVVNPVTLAPGRARLFSSSSPRAPSPPPAAVTLPVVAVGANCATLGSAGITAAGGPAYCAHLPTTDAAVWSLYPGEISSPTMTPGPDDEVYAPETESPVLVCMEQTGQTRLDCHDDILQSNTSPSPPATP